MKRFITVCAISAAMTAGTAFAETVKVGYMTTLSGGAGIIGKQMQNAVNLAMEHKGGKLGGMDAEIIFADDQRKPDVAKQLANRLMKSDRVDVVAGVVSSNLPMAIHKTVTRKGTLFVVFQTIKGGGSITESATDKNHVIRFGSTAMQAFS